MMLPAINQQQVRQHFSEHASEYDLYARVQKRVAANLIDQTLELSFDGPVLDIGTGTGEVVRHLLDRSPQQSVIVSDLAHDMTLTAQRNLSRVQAVDADAQALPFRDDSFGLVLSASVFQWIEELPVAFRECARVLKPGGYLVFAMFCDGTLKELSEVFGEALLRCRSDRPNHFQGFPDLSEVESALQRPELSGISCTVEIETDYHPSFRHLMRGLKKIGAQNSSRERPTGLFPRKVMAEMERLYGEKFRTGEGLPASYGVLYGIARKV